MKTPNDVKQDFKKMKDKLQRDKKYLNANDLFEVNEQTKHKVNQKK